MNIATAIRGRKPAWVSDSPVVPPLITALGVFILFSIVAPHFGTARTVAGIMNATSTSAIVVIGVALLMICGEFDLSAGATLAMGAFVFGKIATQGGSPVLAALAAVGVGLLLGAINGLLTVGTGLPSFIVTLGTRSVYRALVWVFSGGLMLQTTERLPAYDILNGPLDTLNDLIPGASFRTVTLWALLLVIIFQFVLTRMRFGNSVFAVGDNPGAARAQGIGVNRVRLISFAITGALAAFAGVMTFSQFTSAFVQTGAGLELTAVAAAVVGGARLTGGYGSLVGALLGILLINMLRSGVVLLGLPSDNFEAIVGLTIIAAAFLNERMSGRL